jgi:hypothetical protein
MPHEDMIAGFREGVEILRNIVQSNDLIQKAHETRQDSKTVEQLMSAAWGGGSGSSGGKGSAPGVIAAYQDKYPEMTPYIDLAYEAAASGPAALRRYLKTVEAMLLDFLDLLPPQPTKSPTLDDALKRRRSTGQIPGSNIRWRQFFDGVRAECHVPNPYLGNPRGFSDETIKDHWEALIGKKGKPIT